MAVEVAVMGWMREDPEAFGEYGGEASPRLDFRLLSHLQEGAGRI